MPGSRCWCSALAGRGTQLPLLQVTLVCCSPAPCPCHRQHLPHVPEATQRPPLPLQSGGEKKASLLPQVPQPDGEIRASAACPSLCCVPGQLSQVSPTASLLIPIRKKLQPFPPPPAPFKAKLITGRLPNLLKHPEMWQGWCVGLCRGCG